MKNTRFASMRAVQDGIRDEILHLKEIDCQDLNKNTFDFLSKKLAQPSVRSSFALWIYEYVKICAMHEGIELKPIRNSKLFDTILPFMMEVGISVMYLENHNMDEKAGWEGKLDSKNKQIAATLLKDYLFDYLDNGLECKESKIVSKYLRGMFKSVMTCQYLEKNNNYDIYKESPKGYFQDNYNTNKYLGLFESIIQELSDKINGKEEAIRYYFLRCYLFNVPMFKSAVKIICQLTGYKGNEYQNLSDFAGYYGVLLQVVNDNSDFIKERGTRGKETTDVLSDLRNKTITLPIMFHLAKNKTDGLIEEYMSNFDFKLIKGKHDLVLKELLISGAYKEAFLVGKKIAKNAQALLKYDNEYLVAKNLRDLPNIGYNNRFYRHYFNGKAFYKKKNNQNGIYKCEDNMSPKTVNNFTNKKQFSIKK